MFQKKPINDAAKRIVQSAPLTPLIRKHELAEQLNISTKTIERWLEKGLLPMPFKTKTGRTVGWATHQIETWSGVTFK